jgi:hypothetical protein
MFALLLPLAVSKPMCIHILVLPTELLSPIQMNTTPSYLNIGENPD